MLMAAGLGTRLRPFTDRRPKPLLPLMGVPMAQLALDRLAQFDVTKVVANYHHLPEVSRSGLSRLDRHGMELRLSDESGLLLGSAGGLARALPLLGEGPSYLVNADVVCDVDLRALAVRHAVLRAQWGVSLTLALFPRGPAGGRYREIHADPSTGLIRGYGELQEGRPFYVGTAVIEPEALEGVSADRAGDFVPLILDRAIRERKAGFFMSDGLWLDVGEPKHWLAAHLALMMRLETGGLPLEWRRRLEGENRRMAPNLWISSRSVRRKFLMNWAAPCYWSSEEEDIPEVGETPRHLGPRCVFYGRVPRVDNHREFRDGIAYAGDWVTVPATE
jgi:MurNAc alpha-1-phosphate uridylyltransferase